MSEKNEAAERLTPTASKLASQREVDLMQEVLITPVASDADGVRLPETVFKP